MTSRGKSGGMFDELKRKMAETLLRRESRLGVGQDRLRALTEMAGLSDVESGEENGVIRKRGPAEKVSVEVATAEVAPVEVATAEVAPVEAAPVEIDSAEVAIIAEDTPVKVAPAFEEAVAPVEVTPVEVASVETASVDVAPAEVASSSFETVTAPVEVAPVEVAPVETASVWISPVKAASVDVAPTSEEDVAPVEVAPVCDIASPIEETSVADIDDNMITALDSADKTLAVENADSSSEKKDASIFNENDDVVTEPAVVAALADSEESDGEVISTDQPSECLEENVVSPTEDVSSMEEFAPNQTFVANEESTPAEEVVSTSEQPFIQEEDSSEYDSYKGVVTSEEEGLVNEPSMVVGDYGAVAVVECDASNVEVIGAIVGEKLDEISVIAEATEDASVFMPVSTETSVVFPGQVTVESSFLEEAEADIPLVSDEGLVPVDITSSSNGEDYPENDVTSHFSVVSLQDGNASLSITETLSAQLREHIENIQAILLNQQFTRMSVRSVVSRPQQMGHFMSLNLELSFMGQAELSDHDDGHDDDFFDGDNQIPPPAEDEHDSAAHQESATHQEEEKKSDASEESSAGQAASDDQQEQAPALIAEEEHTGAVLENVVEEGEEAVAFEADAPNAVHPENEEAVAYDANQSFVANDVFQKNEEAEASNADASNADRSEDEEAVACDASRSLVANVAQKDEETVVSEADAFNAVGSDCTCDANLYLVANVAQEHQGAVVSEVDASNVVVNSEPEEEVVACNANLSLVADVAQKVEDTVVLETDAFDSVRLEDEEAVEEAVACVANESFVTVPENEDEVVACDAEIPSAVSQEDVEQSMTCEDGTFSAPPEVSEEEAVAYEADVSTSFIQDEEEETEACKAATSAVFLSEEDEIKVTPCEKSETASAIAIDHQVLASVDDEEHGGVMIGEDVYQKTFVACEPESFTPVSDEVKDKAVSNKSEICVLLSGDEGKGEAVVSKSDDAHLFSASKKELDDLIEEEEHGGVSIGDEADSVVYLSDEDSEIQARAAIFAELRTRSVFGSVSPEPSVAKSLVEEAFVEEPTVKQPTIDDAVAKKVFVEEIVPEQLVSEEPVAEDSLFEKLYRTETTIFGPFVTETPVNEPVAIGPAVAEDVSAGESSQKLLRPETSIFGPCITEPSATSAMNPAAEETSIEEPITKKPSQSKDSSDVSADESSGGEGKAATRPASQNSIAEAIARAQERAALRASRSTSDGDRPGLGQPRKVSPYVSNGSSPTRRSPQVSPFQRNFNEESSSSDESDYPDMVEYPRFVENDKGEKVLNPHFWDAAEREDCRPVARSPFFLDSDSLRQMVAQFGRFSWFNYAVPDLRRLCKDQYYFELRERLEKEMLMEQVQQYRQSKTVDLMPEYYASRQEHLDSVRGSVNIHYKGLFGGVTLYHFDLKPEFYQPRQEVADLIMNVCDRLYTSRWELEMTRRNYILADTAFSKDRGPYKRVSGSAARKVHDQAKARLLEIMKREHESRDRPLHEFGNDFFCMEMYQNRLSLEKTFIEFFGVAPPPKKLEKDTVVHKTKIEMAMEMFQGWPYEIQDLEYFGKKLVGEESEEEYDDEEEWDGDDESMCDVERQMRERDKEKTYWDVL